MLARNMGIKCVIIFFFYPVLCFSYLYDLAVATMVKNEARWIIEWIEYHRFIGVNHFYIYDNNSVDNLYEILSEYIDEGTVEIIDWNTKVAPFQEPCQFGNARWVGYQITAFNDAIERSNGLARWIALLDVDEFIFCSKGPTVGVRNFNTLLKNQSEDVGSILLNWWNFGTSNIKILSENKLITENMVMRAVDSIPENRFYKSIHRPESIYYSYTHEAFLKKGYKKIRLDPKEYHINHYYLKDKRNCFLKRAFNDPKAMEQLEKKYNAVLDIGMLEYIPFFKANALKNAKNLR